MDKISFFPVGNGDSVLMEVDGFTIMTDIHYRAKTEDESEDDYYPFRDDLKKACKIGNEYRLDYFVSTHPDKDHILGFDTVFHTGEPSNYSSSDDTILIEEIWVSPYGANPNYTTDASEALVNEIKRRKNLQGKVEADKVGNRLRILSRDDAENNEGAIGGHLTWKLLAPTDDEASIEESDDNESKNSSNNSSLVISWNYTNGNKSEYILLGGDAGYEVWERIRDDFSDENLKWSVLLAPHHCSRCSLQYKNDNDEYIDADDAISALSVVHGKGFVVSSSKKIKKDEDRPPAWEAKQKYLKILKNAHEANHEERFLNPQTYGDNEKPKPVIFNLTSNGLVLDRAKKSNVRSSSGYIGAASTPATYGNQ